MSNKIHSAKITTLLLTLCLIASSLWTTTVSATSNSVDLDFGSTEYDDNNSIITAKTNNTALNTVKQEIFGANISWRDNGYDLWDSQNDAVNATLLQKLEDSGVKQLRYPGGIEGDYLHWAETVGTNRVDQIDAFSSIYPTYDETDGVTYPVNFGMEEFLQVCNAADIKAVLQFNAGTGTPGEANALVDWLNNNNYLNQISSICIGNEVHFNNNRVAGIDIQKTPSQYIDFANSIINTATSSILKNNSVKLGVIGLPSSHPLSRNDNWDASIISQLKDSIDFIDVHIGYSYYTKQNESKEAAAKCYLASSKWVSDMISEEKATIEQYAGENADNIDIHISELGPVGGSYSNSVVGALYLADLMNVILAESKITSTDYLTLLNHYDSAQLIGYYGHDQSGNKYYWDNAVSFIYKMYSDMVGRKVLSTSVSGASKFDSEAVGLIPAISDVDNATVNTYYDETTGKGSVFVLNKSLTDNLVYDIALPFNVTVTGATELWNENYDAANRYNGQPVSTTAYPGLQNVRNSFTLKTKPVSLVKVDFAVVTDEFVSYEDEFNGDTMGNYKIAGPDNGIWGNWAQENGMLQVTGNTSANWYGTTCLIRKNFTDFTMEFDADLLSGYGIFLRAQDDASTVGEGLNKWFGGNTYAIMHWDPTNANARFEVFDYNGSASSIYASGTGKVGAMSRAHWVITANGDAITFTVTDISNTTNSFTYTLTDSRYSKGGIAFYNLTKAGVTSLKIDNLKITPLGKKLYDFSDDEQLGDFFTAGPDNGKWGNWQAVNGNLQVTGNTGANWWGTSFVNKYQYGDFTLEFDATVSAGYGIILRAEDDGSTSGAGLNKWFSGNAYVIFHHTDSQSKIQVYNYNGAQTAIGSSVSDATIHGKSSVHWIVKCTGNTISYTVTDNNDPTNVVSGSVTDATYSDGYFGFYNLTKAGVTSLKVDNLKITGDSLNDPFESTVWYDNFSGSTGGKYTAHGGFWNNFTSLWTDTDYTGVLGNENLANGITYYYLNNFEFGDVSVEYDIDSYVSGAHFGIVLRAANPSGEGNGGDAYTVMYDGNWLFAGRIDGSFTQITTGSPYAYNPTNNGLTLNHLKVSVEGNTIKIYVNRINAPVITVTDETFKAGFVGIRTNAIANTANNVVFDNLRVCGNVKGDLNGDLSINIIDLVRMKKCLVYDNIAYNTDSAELDGDGNFGAGDLVCLKQYLLGLTDKVYNYNYQP